MGFVLLILLFSLVPPPDGMRFEGTVGVEGSEPLTVLVLYLDSGEKLILELDRADRFEIQNNLPGRIEVIGRVSVRETHLGKERVIAVDEWHWVNEEVD